MSETLFSDTSAGPHKQKQNKIQDNKRTRQYKYVWNKYEVKVDIK